MEEREKFIYPKIGIGTGKTPRKILWAYIGHNRTNSPIYPTMTLTPEEIAHKYVHGLHDALTDNQEKKDMISDIEALIRTVHFNACRTMMHDCAAKWNHDINKLGGGYPRHPQIDIVKK